MDFDSQFIASWRARAHLFQNRFLDSVVTRLADNDERGVLKMFIPELFSMKRQSSVASDADAAANISVAAPFDPARFSFDKAKPEETIARVDGATLEAEFIDSGLKISPKATRDAIILDGASATDEEAQHHVLMINGAPVIPFHGLLVPSPKKHLPQQLQNLNFVLLPLEVLYLLSGRSDSRMIFNSLGGWASVNHMHYHFTYVGEAYEKIGGRFPVEVAPRRELYSVAIPDKSDLYFKLERITWPIPGLLFSLVPSSPSDNLAPFLPRLAQAAHTLLAHLIANNRAHNVLWTSSSILIMPRKHQKWLLSSPKDGVLAVAYAEACGIPIFGDLELCESYDSGKYDDTLAAYALDEDELERLGVVAGEALNKARIERPSD